MHSKTTEMVVGIFLLLGILGLVILAFKVSGLTQIGNRDRYILYAEFDNIGGLKERAAVRVSGVTVGRVTAISLDPKSFRARVIMEIDKNVQDLPDDTSASILTQGVLGANYVGLTVGFDVKMLKPGDTIETTHSALILENLIGQILFNVKNKKE